MSKEEDELLIETVNGCSLGKVYAVASGHSIEKRVRVTLGATKYSVISLSTYSSIGQIGNIVYGVSSVLENTKRYSTSDAINMDFVIKSVAPKLQQKLNEAMVGYDESKAIDQVKVNKSKTKANATSAKKAAALRAMTKAMRDNAFTEEEVIEAWQASCVDRVQGQ